MQAWQLERNSKRWLITRTNDVEPRKTALKLNILCTNIGGVIQSIGQHSSADVADNFVYARIVGTNHSESVERQVMQKLNKAGSKALDVTVIRRHMVRINIRHDRQHGFQVHKGRI